MFLKSQHFIIFYNKGSAYLVVCVVGSTHTNHRRRRNALVARFALVGGLGRRAGSRLAVRGTVVAALATLLFQTKTKPLSCRKQLGHSLL